MTREQFISKIPRYISAPPGTGYSTVDIIMDTKFRKGACYRDEHAVASCYVFGDWWDEVYEKLILLLEERGLAYKNKG